MTQPAGPASTREFPTAVVASLSSGTLLCDFSAMHECAEFLMGHPIWTHHFADKALWQAMRRAIKAQCPGMPTKLKDVTRDNYRTHVTNIEAKHGATQTIRKGDGSTAMSPLDGIPEGKAVVVVAPADFPGFTAEQIALGKTVPAVLLTEAELEVLAGVCPVFRNLVPR